MTIDKARPMRVEGAQIFTSKIRFASGKKPPSERKTNKHKRPVGDLMRLIFLLKKEMSLFGKGKEGDI